MEKLIEGVVIESAGDTAKVRCSIHSDCENCGVCPGSNAMIIDVINEIGVEAGQQVLVENRESNMLLAAFLIYILPLLAIGCGIGLGYYISSRLPISPVLSMIAGGVVLACGALYN
jgi:sigma-E factor negative regulatory protein RseC